MPQLKFRGVPIDKICQVSKALINSLTQVIGCPSDSFTLEHIPSTFVMEGKITEEYPFVEVAWFDRGQETQDKVAKIVTDAIKTLGYADVDVFFTVFSKEKYYENGEHF